LNSNYLKFKLNLNLINKLKKIKNSKIKIIENSNSKNNSKNN
jgi:hypothetical protein